MNGGALKLVKGKIAIAMCHFYRYTANINSNKTGTTLVSWKFPQELRTCKQVHYIRLSVEETSCWQKSIVNFLADVFVFLIIQSVATVNWGVGSVFHPQKIHIYFNMYVHFNFDKLAAYFGRKTISLDENIYFVQFNKRRSWVSWEGLTKEIFCCPSWYSQILHKLTLSLKSLNKSAPIFAE